VVVAVELVVEEVELLVVELVGVELVVVVEVVVVELVVVFGVLVVVVVSVVVVPLRQSIEARSATVEAPWFSTWVSVRLIDGGRFATSLRSESAALLAAAQLPFWTAVETESSAALKLLAWSPESRPASPPQAASEHAARVSPPARSARGA
jgi:hypothetical protein